MYQSQVKLKLNADVCHWILIEDAVGEEMDMTDAQEHFENIEYQTEEDLADIHDSDDDLFLYIS